MMAFVATAAAMWVDISGTNARGEACSIVFYCVLKNSMYGIYYLCAENRVNVPVV